jgi:oligosaccharide translocation protein RFT1
MSTTQDNVEANGNLLRASLQSGASLMGLQLMSRLFTFILNQALLRLASPKVFGTAAIQFELLVSTILFLSREGARNAALRKSTQAHDRQSIAPLGFLPFMLGCPLAVITTVSYCRLAVEETKNQPHFKLAIGLYALAAIIELLSEPMHMR